VAGSLSSPRPRRRGLEDWLAGRRGQGVRPVAPAQPAQWWLLRPGCFSVVLFSSKTVSLQ
jgi:hypothetical protein